MARSLLAFSLLVLSVSPAWAQSMSVYRDAVTALEQRTRLNPADLSALQDLASAYLMLNELPLAEATLNSALKLDPKSKRSQQLLGKLAFAKADYARAKKIFQALQGSQTPEIWYELAQIALATGDASGFRDAVQKGIQQSQKQVDLQAQFMLLQADSDSRQAPALLQAAAALPGLSQAQLDAIQTRQDQLLIQDGQVRKLLNRQFQSLEQALQQGTETEILKHLRQLEESLARSKSPEEDRAFYQLNLEQQVERFPSQTALRQQLIQLYQRQKQHENLLAFYRSEMMRQRGQWDSLTLAKSFHQMADVHLALGYLQFAFDNYQRAAERNPQDFEAIKRMGVIYLSARDLKEAQKRFEQVAREWPLDSENRLFLALSYAYDKQDERAKTLLSQIASDIRPDLHSLTQAVLSLSERRPSEEIWRQLLLPEQMLGD